MKHIKKGQGKFIQEKDYQKSILFAKEDFTGQNNLLQIVTIPPHTKQRLHYHTKQIEVSYVLQGEALFVFNNKEILAEVGDAFICEPGDKHFVWNRSNENFRLIVFKIDFPEGPDTVWLEE